jgi:hypothetical protein
MVVVPQKLLDIHNGDIHSAVSELMAPYQENNMGDCPKEFLKFDDVEKEYLTEFNGGIEEGARVPKDKFVSHGDEDNGSVVQDPNDEGYFLVSRFHKMFEKNTENHSRTHEIPADFEIVQIPFSLLYGTFEEFMRIYHGYKERDADMGRYGYWENPNAKWDYWRIGGRWRGYLRVKEGVQPDRSSLDWDSPKEEQPKSAELAQLKDIDFEAMNMKATTNLEKYWGKVAILIEAHNKVMNRTGKHPLREELDEILENESGHWEFDILWTLVDTGLAKWESDEELTKERGTATHRLYMSDITDEEFKTKLRPLFEFSTYAVCTSKDWYESASMGWFGCDDGTPEKKERWRKGFHETFLSHLPQDTWIAICDCHI